METNEREQKIKILANKTSFQFFKSSFLMDLLAKILLWDIYWILLHLQEVSKIGYKSVLQEEH